MRKLQIFAFSLLWLLACGDDANTADGDGTAHGDGGGDADHAGDHGDGGAGDGADTPPSDAGACAPPAALEGETALPAEVADILERRCWQCHVDPPVMYAPMPLETWEDVRAPLPSDNDVAVSTGIARRINDPQFPMPPVTFEQLTDDEKVTLDEWLTACAPAGE